MNFNSDYSKHFINYLRNEFGEDTLTHHVSEEEHVLVTWGISNPEGVFDAHVDKGYVRWYTLDQNNDRDNYQVDTYVSFKLTEDAKDLLRFNLI